MRATFLTGGAPSVVVPAELERRSLEIEFLPEDGRGAFTEQLRADGELALDSYELEAGLYEVRCGPARRTFSMTDGVVSVAGEGAGSVTASGRSGPVSGLHAPAAARRNVVAVPAPRSAWGVVIGPGANDIRPVLRPQWLSDLNPDEYLTWTHVDAWIDFEPTWILDRPEGGALVARRIGDRPPELGGVLRWADQVLEAELGEGEPEAVFLWDRYREAAAG